LQRFSLARWGKQRSGSLTCQTERGSARSCNPGTTRQECCLGMARFGSDSIAGPRPVGQVRHLPLRDRGFAWSVLSVIWVTGGV